MSQKSHLSTKSKVQLIIILFVAIMFFFYLGSNRPSSVGKVIDAGDLIDHADEQAKANVENVVATMKAEFDKEYSDPSLYFEDFSEEIAELDEAYDKTLEAYFSDKMGKPYFTKTYNQYYLPTLKKFRDGEISALEVIADTGTYIRVVKFDMYMMVPEEYNEWTVRILYDYINILEATGLSHYMFQIVEVDNAMIANKTFFEMQALDDPFTKARDENLIVGMDSFSDLVGNSSSWHKGKDENLGYLEEQFNEKFVKVDLDYNLKESYCDYYAPVNDQTLKFLEQAFLKPYAQQAMYEEIEKIIDEEGYDGQIAHIAIPRDRNITIYDEQGHSYCADAVPFDLSLSPDNSTVINEGYRGYYDITLNLLIEEGEEIDYAKLQKITARISDC